MGRGFGFASFFKDIKMKKNAGKITLAVLLFMVCMLIVYALTPAFAIVRSYDQNIRTISMSTVMTGAVDQMFTVSGGAIEIVSMFGQVTTIIANAPGNVTIEFDSAVDPNYDAGFSIAVALANGSLGDVVTFGAITNSENAGVLTENENASFPLSWFCPVGEIEQKLSGTGTGAVKWYMSYRKLDSGAIVSVSEN